ncbi:hypothetical protein FDB72_01085 [Clostridium botulinum]|nr:hypothetical protein [Clostridium botulinum]NFK35307.1 hypothetical protein [Clostridium botulinum H04402 065]NFB66214.1 hypothetical protein [Clostridium botulinum]NFB97012.1 hypothetical protein [Clostridium botulinum]NFC45823.1 hypothetical protein [Clostridium botulinum]
MIIIYVYIWIMQIINKALCINIRFFMKKLPENIFNSNIANKKIHVINT